MICDKKTSISGASKFVLFNMHNEFGEKSLTSILQQMNEINHSDAVMCHKATECEIELWNVR